MAAQAHALSNAVGHGHGGTACMHAFWTRKGDCTFIRRSRSSVNLPRKGHITTGPAGTCAWTTGGQVTSGMHLVAGGKIRVGAREGIEGASADPPRTQLLSCDAQKAANVCTCMYHILPTFSTVRLQIHQRRTLPGRSLYAGRGFQYLLSVVDISRCMLILPISECIHNTRLLNF